MATITSTSLGELLKRLYASWEIQELVNLTYPALEECAAKGNAQLGGDSFYFPVRTESAHGHAYISESANLPAGRQTRVLQANVDPKVHAGVVQLTGLSMSISSGNAMAFARSFDENVQATIRSMSAYKEGALFRDGTGALATSAVTSITAGTAFAVDDVAYLREGMVLDLIQAGGTVRQADVTVSEVDWVNKQLTIDTTVSTTATTEVFYMADSQTGTSAIAVREPEGFGASFSASNTYLGISRTAEPNWQANTLAASSFFDEDILMRARTRVTQESGVQVGGMVGSFKCVVHPMQLDTLFKLAIPRIQYSPGGGFDLGYGQDYPSFGGIRFVTSYQCPPGTAYLGDFQYHRSLYAPNGELHVDTEYNGAALKWVATADQGLVFLKEYHNFAMMKPVCFISITSLTENTR